ncbi:hypothetical protein, partial [Nocardioides sp.]|uniref:hypothetical protein n=1 Tax=Nocardioides sp. TaxID=35761 RepID=UPI00356A11E7
MQTRTTVRRRRPLALLAAGLLTLGLAACGGEDSPSEAGATPEEVMAAAKVTLDETSGVRVALITEDLPEGV